MLKAIIENEVNEFTASVKWRVTEVCNFHCTYCAHKVINPSKLRDDICLAEKTAPEINRIIEELPGNKIKLNLIGGEISLIDLIPILDKITSKKLHTLYLTSNCSAPVDYYKRLFEYCESRNIYVSICFSFHSQCISFDDYSEKILKLKKYKNVKIKLETVYFQKNELIDKFLKFCHENNIYYILDSDIRAKKEVMRDEFKSLCNVKSPRFTVYKGDKKITVESRNSLITGKIPGLKKYTYHKYAVKTKGWYCLRDCDFVYIEKDKHQGFVNGSCRVFQPVQNFHPRKEPIQCNFDGCSLCGRISVAQDKNFLIQFLQN